MTERRSISHLYHDLRQIQIELQLHEQSLLKEIRKVKQESYVYGFLVEKAEFLGQMQSGIGSYLRIMYERFKIEG